MTAFPRNLTDPLTSSIRRSTASGTLQIINTIRIMQDVVKARMAHLLANKLFSVGFRKLLIDKTHFLWFTKSMWAGLPRCTGALFSDIMASPPSDSCSIFMELLYEIAVCLVYEKDTSVVGIVADVEGRADPPEKLWLDAGLPVNVVQVDIKTFYKI